MEEIRRLGDAELEIMQIVWANKKPITSKEILLRIRQRVWRLSTLITVLNRLSDKGYLYCDRTMRENLYSALIMQSSYLYRENKIFLEKLYDNSLCKFMTSLCDSKAVSKEELVKVRDYLNSFVEENPGE